jgi:diaminohydroxyphosphoribosylaminopyrimidine deaminase/5-amino-6-(5-phosphoribosylamino)uracil reductase
VNPPIDAGGPAAGPDDDFMAQAITLAWASRRRVSPRPWVGAVVVPEGSTPVSGPVFAGATDGRSGPHAEVVALGHAGVAAAGSTLYCTLEPCSHHGLTPPCAEAIARAGVARVVVALTDPDQRVAGAGIEYLRGQGVHVDVGIGADEAAIQLEPYLHHRRTGRPLVVLKLAATLDGRVAAPDRTSQWITGAEARADAHGLRADSDAVLVGAGTVRTDDPSLTVRLPGWEHVGDHPGHDNLRQPLRVVLGAAPATARVQPAVELAGHLPDILDELGRRNVLQLLVEGGPAVAHGFHAAGLVDRYVVYLAPALAGGDDGMGMLAGPGAATVADFWRGELARVTQLGSDVRIDVLPRHR